MKGYPVQKRETWSSFMNKSLKENSMKIEEQIAVMDHFRRGGRVENADRTLVVGVWLQATPLWNWNDYTYRIHPEEQAIIDHFNNGGDIECSSKHSDVWSKPLGYPSWNWNNLKYRIKPEETDRWSHDGDCPFFNGAIECTCRPKQPIKVPEKIIHLPVDRRIVNEIISCLNAIVERLK